MKSQIQIFNEEQKKIGETNAVFMALVSDGLTREELARNIGRRPTLWGRYAGFMEQLPSGAPA